MTQAVTLLEGFFAGAGIGLLALPVVLAIRLFHLRIRSLVVNRLMVRQAAE